MNKIIHSPLLIMETNEWFDDGIEINKVFSFEIFRVGIYYWITMDLFIFDNENHWIIQWYAGCVEGEVIGGGNELNQFFDRRGLSCDTNGNLYVVDCENYRIERLNVIYEWKKDFFSDENSLRIKSNIKKSFPFFDRSYSICWTK